jgi:hypothetical protein
VGVIEQSPFPFYGPLAPGEGFGRASLREDLARRIEERRVTALLGPRRYGKTSVLRQVMSDLDGKGFDAVWVDLYASTSMADIAGAFDRGLAATQGPIRKVLDTLAGSLSLSLGLLGVELSKGARDRPEPSQKLRSMLQLLTRAAQKRNIVLVLDEFSGIAGVDGAAGVLRTELQHHFRDLAIVFAGSQPSTMTMLFADRAQPFFSQADLVLMPPLSTEEVIAIVDHGFRSSGRDAGPVPSMLAATSNGHPQRTMQLADAVWQLVPHGGRADADLWAEALERVRESVNSAEEAVFGLMPAGHQKVIRIVASGGSVYGAAADVLSLSNGTARGAVAALLGSADLVRVDDRLEVVDPLLADWVRRRFAV